MALANDHETRGRALGWLSLALGGGALAMPRAIRNLIGVRNDGGLIPLVGAREIAAGIALLTQRDKTPWLWARVLGDVMDLALLEAALANERNDRARLAITLAVITAITAVDVLAAEAASGTAPRETNDRARELLAVDELDVVEFAATA
jgi:hypothetical protein